MPSETNEVTCNATDREELGCNANDGLPCDSCWKRTADEAAYWRGQWNVATFEEKHGREAYEAALRDAGRSER